MIGGCTGNQAVESLHLRPDALAESVRADWDDADAAVHGGLPPTGVTVTEVVPISSTSRQYRLRCMSGEDGALTIDRPAAGAGQDAEIRVRCSIGRLGDPKLEKAVVESVTRRLHELRGVEYAPIR